MQEDTLYKAFTGYFYMLDEAGSITNNYNDKCLFKETYGLVFFYPRDIERTMLYCIFCSR